MATINGMEIISTSVLAQYGKYQLVSHYCGSSVFFYQVLCDGFDLATFNSDACMLAQHEYDRLVANCIAAEDREKQLSADRRAQQWLAEYNIAREKGNTRRAETCYRKAQFWLDRLNRLEGLA